MPQSTLCSLHRGTGPILPFHITCLLRSFPCRTLFPLPLACRPIWVRPETRPHPHRPSHHLVQRGSNTFLAHRRKTINPIRDQNSSSPSLEIEQPIFDAPPPIHHPTTVMEASGPAPGPRWWLSAVPPLTPLCGCVVRSRDPGGLAMVPSAGAGTPSRKITERGDVRLIRWVMVSCLTHCNAGYVSEVWNKRMRAPCALHVARRSRMLQNIACTTKWCIWVTARHIVYFAVLREIGRQWSSDDNAHRSLR